MKLSLDWLSDFVDLSGLSAQEIADKLSMGAFEVEEVRKTGPDIEGPLLVGEILEINPHPNADKIRLTKIKLSDQSPAQDIVCGAWNIEVGQKIPVALPGARVINRHDNSPLLIKESKIRGVASNGMLCSAPELGIQGSGEGILILDPATKIGLDAKDLLGIKNDHILIVEPRSNRGDALSVLGLAREVAALFERPLKSQSWIEEFDQMQEESSQPSTEVDIENEDECQFFSLRTLTGIKVSGTSSIIGQRLESLGIKLVNNIVDITNYVLHELGQPLHAYDLTKISGKVKVRRAKESEVLLTLDGKTRALNQEILVIADDNKVLGLAGVMGGKESEVSQNTSTIALEAASFQSQRVRKSSRLLGLSSDSSLRFERGVDAAQVLQASNRASYLALKHMGARLAGLSKKGCDKAPELKVQLRMSELKRICEIEMSPAKAGQMLAALGFESVESSQEQNGGVLTVKVPSFRQKDVGREIDLIEELTRLHGYDKVPVSMPQTTIAAETPDMLPGKIREALQANGLYEAWLSSLVSQEEAELAANTGDGDSSVAVRNPLSAEHQVLRRSLLPGLLRAIAYNLARGNQNPGFFELGKIYKRQSEIDADGEASSKPAGNNNSKKLTGTCEELMLAAAISGPRKLSEWQEDSKASERKEKEGSLYFQIKGVLQNLCLSLGIPNEALCFERSSELNGFFHPGRSAVCFIDKKALKSHAANNKNKQKSKERMLKLASLGEIHPLVADKFELGSISKRIAALELSVETIASLIPEPAFKEIFATPTSCRDLTVDLPCQLPAQKVEEEIRRSADQRLKKIELVSVFNLNSDKRSLSYRLSFQDPAETLKNEDIEKILEKIRKDLVDKLPVEFRL